MRYVPRSIHVPARDAARAASDEALAREAVLEGRRRPGRPRPRALPAIASPNASAERNEARQLARGEWPGMRRDLDRRAAEIVGDRDTARLAAAAGDARASSPRRAMPCLGARRAGAPGSADRGPPRSGAARPARRTACRRSSANVSSAEPRPSVSTDRRERCARRRASRGSRRSDASPMRRASRRRPRRRTTTPGGALYGAT